MWNNWCKRLDQCFSRWAESPLWGRFWWARGRKHQRGRLGGEKISRGRNYLITNRSLVNFSILLLWLVRFLQILIYNHWRLLLKQFICWIFSLDLLCAPLQCGLFQGCGTVVKMSQLQFRSFSFHEHCSRSGALGFHECGSGVLFCHGSGPAPVSVRFHRLIF